MPAGLLTISVAALVALVLAWILAAPGRGAGRMRTAVALALLAVALAAMLAAIPAYW